MARVQQLLWMAIVNQKPVKDIAICLFASCRGRKILPSIPLFCRAALETFKDGDTIDIMKIRWRVAGFALSLLLITACAAQKPVLSPNAYLTSVGSSVAEQDVDECIAHARAGAEAAPNEKNSQENPIAGVARSSTVGAAAGGAGGAIFGHAGQGAAAGAVGGAVGSLTNALWGWAFERKPPEPIIRQLTEQCLRKKGYEPVGWK